MATKKSKTVIPKPTIESLQNQVELMKHEFGTLKELIYTPILGNRPDFRHYLFPHISFKILRDRSKIKIIGESFSTPSISVSPIRFHNAKIFVQSYHYGSWHIHENGTTTVQIDKDGNFDIDITYLDEYFEGLKIIAVDLKTGRSSNELNF